MITTLKEGNPSFLDIAEISCTVVEVKGRLGSNNSVFSSALWYIWQLEACSIQGRVEPTPEVKPICVATKALGSTQMTTQALPWVLAQLWH